MRTMRQTWQTRTWMGLVTAGLAAAGCSGAAPPSGGAGLNQQALGGGGDDDQMGPHGLAGAHPRRIGHHSAPPGGPGKSHKGVPLGGIDSLVNFTGQFTAAGVDPFGNPQDTWQYAMVGKSPTEAKTTHIGAPVIPVSIDLRNYDGSPRYVNGQRLFLDGTKNVAAALGSPVFQKARYSSSHSPTQFADAVHRAQFWNAGKMQPLDDGWHNLLDARVGTPRTMVLNRGSYRFSLHDDGTCCRYVLIDADVFTGELFPPSTPDMTTVIGAAEVSGDITTADMSSFLFPDTYLYLNGDPNQCCVLGFHSFDYEAGDAGNGYLPRFYVMNYSSWISPGIFGDSFVDVTALSHEISETYSDPFVGFDGVHNTTPWWLSQNGNCQDDLEVGDVIEGLPNASYPVTLHGVTYHPQNEALLQYFEFRSPSDAIDGAYSYPDTSVITQPSAFQNANCQ